MDERDVFVENIISHEEWGTILNEFRYRLTQPQETQYVKVIAKNIGLCPEWHKGAGNKSWIFADEIIIE